MTVELPEDILEPWNPALDRLYFAYQPIVESASGRLLGYEALIRGVVGAGFSSIDHFFDCAFLDRALYAVDLRLREKALTPFAAAGPLHGAPVFYNIDNRVLAMPDYLPGNTISLAGRFGVATDTIVFEISEKHEINGADGSVDIMRIYQQQGIGIALDDYGTAYSGIKLLFDAAPDYVKIDRYFIDGITDDFRKRFFVGHIVDMIHGLGGSVIAEGIETDREAATCARLGCDYLQGFGIMKPSADLDALAEFAAGYTRTRNIS